VNRRRLPWLLSIALIAVGSVTAHTSDKGVCRALQ
jgi:hypothetical protein